MGETTPSGDELDAGFAAKGRKRRRGKSREDFPAILSEIRRSVDDEVRAKIGRLDGLIGISHFPSVGNYREQVIREAIGKVVPGKFSINTGFVASHYIGKKQLSQQMDILIWDSHNHAPVIQSGDFVVIRPQSLRAAISVKSYLDRPQFLAGMANLESLSCFAQEIMRDSESWKIVPFARFLVFTSPRYRTTFPGIPLDEMRKLQSRNAGEIADRLDWCGQFPQYSAMKWVNGVSALNGGYLRTSVHLREPHFVAHQVVGNQDQAMEMLLNYLEAALQDPKWFSIGPAGHPIQEAKSIVFPETPETRAFFR